MSTAKEGLRCLVNAQLRVNSFMSVKCGTLLCHCHPCFSVSFELLMISLRNVSLMGQVNLRNGI